jgi:hypothetical protein
MRLVWDGRGQSMVINVEGRRACESVTLLIACRDLAQGVVQGV